MTEFQSIKNINIYNRQAVLGFLKDCITDDMPRVSKLMLAYDSDILYLLNNEMTIQNKMKFINKLITLYGLNEDICDNVFDDWCNILEIPTIKGSVEQKTIKDFDNKNYVQQSKIQNCVNMAIYPRIKVEQKMPMSIKLTELQNKKNIQIIGGVL